MLFIIWARIWNIRTQTFDAIDLSFFESLASYFSNYYYSLIDGLSSRDGLVLAVSAVNDSAIEDLRVRCFRRRELKFRNPIILDYFLFDNQTSFDALIIDFSDNLRDIGNINKDPSRVERILRRNCVAPLLEGKLASESFSVVSYLAETLSKQLAGRDLKGYPVYDIATLITLARSLVTVPFSLGCLGLPGASLVTFNSSYFIKYLADAGTTSPGTVLRIPLKSVDVTADLPIEETGKPIVKVTTGTYHRDTDEPLTLESIGLDFDGVLNIDQQGGLTRYSIQDSLATKLRETDIQALVNSYVVFNLIVTRFNGTERSIDFKTGRMYPQIFVKRHEIVSLLKHGQV